MIPVFPDSKVALKGKKGLVVGIANDQSIAWGCARAFRALGADLAGWDRASLEATSR